MIAKRKVEVFSAGCPTCEDVVAIVTSIACPSCEVRVLDMNDAGVAARAKSLGVRSVPGVVVDGELASCCAGGDPTKVCLERPELAKRRSMRPPVGLSRRSR